MARRCCMAWRSMVNGRSSTTSATSSTTYRDADVYRRADGTGKRRGVLPVRSWIAELISTESSEVAEIDLVPASRLEQHRRRAAGCAQRVRQQRVSAHARPAHPGGRGRSGLYPPAPFRCVKALWDDDGN